MNALFRTLVAGIGFCFLGPWSAPASAAPSGDDGFRIVHEFTGNGGTGSDPNGALVQMPDGRLWGTASYGGTSKWGDVFKLSTGGQVKVMQSFREDGGYWPMAGLVQGRDGLLYGTTSRGAGDVCTLFRIDAKGQLAVLHEFTLSGPTGYGPNTELTAASDGNLYGTSYDFAAQRSIAFRLAPSGEVTPIHFFIEDEGSHTSTLVEGADGQLYGVTTYHGPKNQGTAFRMSPDGVVTVLYAFGRNNGKPYGPNSLMLATDGLFYGTTVFGGQAGMGTVFRMTPAGEVTVLYEFAGGADDGARPNGRLVQAADGLLYGVTQLGGASDTGVVYRVSPTTGQHKVLHHFSLGGDGERVVPSGALLQASDGRLYGTTRGGGASGAGVVYSLKPR